jgi:hypothetical protein
MLIVELKSKHSTSNSDKTRAGIERPTSNGRARGSFGRWRLKVEGWMF